MKFSLSLLALFVLIQPQVTSQVRLSAYIGMGSYHLGDQRDRNQRILHEDPENFFYVPYSLLEDFPDYFNYSADLEYDVSDNASIVIGYRYTSSGSRLYYEDYSGYALFDQMVSAHFIHLSLFRKVYSGLFDLSPYLSTGVSLNSLTTHYQYDIFTSGDQREVVNEFKSQNLAGECGFRMSKSFGSFGVHAKLGYYLDLYAGGIYKIREYPIEEMIRWNGYRASIGMSFSFF